MPPGAKQQVLDVLEPLLASGAQGMISGCTEIPMVVTQPDIEIPYFDSAQLFVDAALTFCLSD